MLLMIRGTLAGNRMSRCISHFFLPNVGNAALSVLLVILCLDVIVTLILIIRIYQSWNCHALQGLPGIKYLYAPGIIFILPVIQSD